MKRSDQKEKSPVKRLLGSPPKKRSSTAQLEREDVLWAYRLFLDREPDTEEDIQRNLDAWSSRADLRRGFMSSPEFRDKNPGDLAYTPETTLVIKEIAPGLRLYLDLSDVAIGLNVARGRYEPSEIAYARSVVGRGDFVLDVGANIGFFALHLASMVGPTGHVYAYEPLDQNAALLEMSVRENGLEERVTIYRHAVGAEPGEAEIVFLSLEDGAQNSGGAYLSTASRDVPTYHRLLRTRVVPLDSETFACPIRFIKIDVEGAESLVFRGARRLLSEDRPVILSEINPGQIRKVAASTPREMISEMEAIGYECVLLENGRPGRAVRDVPGDRVRSVVFRPRAT
ncbi:MAG: FkbM family methyltransferase [Acidobacteriota bacterium]